MRRFFEACKDEPKLAPLVRELTWTNNLLIMAGKKSSKAREFYIKLCMNRKNKAHKTMIHIEFLMFHAAEVFKEKLLIDLMYRILPKQPLKRKIRSFLCPSSIFYAFLCFFRYFLLLARLLLRQ
ncbi:MAG: DUF1016 N-terminal domain-containing protein [Treponema sp.]|nr:DUF1016 N-terminal domain-containing protein [Treponema sp.]